MRILFLDCFSGISGDMTVGALCDLGVQPSTFEWELSKLEIGDFHMHFERRQRQAIEGVKFGIHEGDTHTHGQEDGDADECCGHHHEHGKPHEHTHDEAHSHGETHAHSHDKHEHCEAHAHSHDEHEHCDSHAHSHGRGFAEIKTLIERSDLSGFVKAHAVSIFRRVAVAEGKIHGKPPEEVTFHEVGALDSIADIVCACVGIEQLRVERVLVSPLHDGRGWIDCAHGQYPIPCTATLEILKGIPVAQIDEPYEFITPTGAAIVAEFGHSFGVMPELRVERIGYGIGSRKLPNRPNVLRAILGEADSSADTSYQTDVVARVETNLDDLSPEITGAVLGKLLEAGALDVFFTPIQMKKNRPGVQLSVICEEHALAKIANLIFSETSSFGIRMDRVNRWKLERKFETVVTPFGGLTVKLGLHAGKIVQVAPEFESCRAASDHTGQPLRAVYDAAMKAYHPNSDEKSQ
jgi:uncharacterized protein (TIGR00299 family) protein